MHSWLESEFKAFGKGGSRGLRRTSRLSRRAHDVPQVTAALRHGFTTETIIEPLENPEEYRVFEEGIASLPRTRR